MDFWVPYRGSVIRLATDRIERIEAERDYIRIIGEGRSYLLRATLGDMESRLASQSFVRIHRSTVIDLTRIKGMRYVGAGAWVVIDADDTERPVGRNYLSGIRHRLRL
ncbi:LytTR family DNA-binding domain-containing protein [Sphingomonas sp. Leaf62]|uniref:LytTR family DNA-binding domain-containing protein n=1 Tax=Sphingomonas sp. Leaf62 TaxID=1736228 RepID=UPI0006FA1A35|nr:LytTR family DNA-binding domain-containing protein [Sphingomonas sp. Leaf62]KQN78472.1 hypothetical protein ASE91_13675 [Sphingomonas sp. Leaf62]